MEGDNIGTKPHHADPNQGRNKIPLLFEMTAIGQKGQGTSGNIVLVEEIKVIGYQILEKQPPFFQFENGRGNSPLANLFFQHIQIIGKSPGMIQSRTFEYLPPLIIAALLYLAVVMLLTFVLRKIEKRLAKSDRNGGKK